MQTGSGTRLIRGYRFSAFYLVGGLAGLDAFAQLEGSSPMPGASVGVALALFAVAFGIATQRARAGRPPRWGVALLVAQLPACAVVPAAVFVMAFEAPFVLTGAALVRWLAFQGLLTVVLLSTRSAALLAGVPQYPGQPLPVAVALRALSWLGAEAVIAAAAVLGAQALRARRELDRVNAELGATRRLLSEGARSAQNARVSRQDDDTVEQQLTELVLRLELAAQQASPPADVALRSAQDVSRRLLSELRGFLSRPGPAPGHVDLARPLWTLTAGIEGHRVHLSSPERLEVSPGVACGALWCVREALSNALRRSGARNVWVEVQRSAAALELEIRDDGHGARQGIGLGRMRERIEEAGGRLAVEAGPGRGFTVSAVLPLEDGAGPARQ
jgi:signal transduction histidine kinase